ncbi:platelet glycoprotein VI-like [Gracilinanus agilis]|uniref:platelet glycoprotein VI-like n=1 Tax=Gracilinanus agilis TaxID=191870 RepID=UPI001CFC519A|nr:platelet glycoprotein VI-like [Gracilinanus agilis]
MDPSLPALLCFGLYLGLKIAAKMEELPRPQIILDNGSVVPLGMPLTIRCRGPPQAEVYYLRRTNQTEDPVGGQRPIWNEVLFSFPKMRHTMAGIYTCIYLAALKLSPPSEEVNLAVAGVLPRPLLFVKPGRTLVRGSPMTLRCWSDQKLDRMLVYHEQGRVPPTFRKTSRSLGQLRFSRMREEYAGTYFCIGYTSSQPLMWSLPSNPLTLKVIAGQDPAVGSVVVVLGALGVLGALLS